MELFIARSGKLSQLKCDYAALRVQVCGMQDSPNKWGNVAFSRHFYLGEGAAVTLGETGNFKGIVDFYFYRLGKYNDVNAQIIEEARKHPAGSLSIHLEIRMRLVPTFLY